MVMVRVKRKEKPQAEATGPDLGDSAMYAVNRFIDEARRYADSSLTTYGSFLVGRYRQVFGTECPGGMLCLIKAKIAYRLQYLGMRKHKKEPTAKFLKNYHAAQKMELDDMDSDAKFFLELDVKREKAQQGDDAMARVEVKVAKAEKKERKERKEKAPKEPRVTVRGKFAELFAENHRAKLTDEKILKVVNDEFGGGYKLADVKGYRAGYNRRLGKGGCESVAYEK